LELNYFGKETKPNPKHNVTKSIPKTFTSIANTDGIWLKENFSKITRYTTTKDAPIQRTPIKIKFILKASLTFPLKVNYPLS
jgi:hypothetical protein